MPKKFMILGLGRQDMSDQQFRKRLHEGVNKFSRSGKADAKTWNKFAKNILYKADFNKAEIYNNIKNKSFTRKEWDTTLTRIFTWPFPHKNEVVASGSVKQAWQPDKLKKQAGNRKPLVVILLPLRPLNKNLLKYLKNARSIASIITLVNHIVQNIMAFPFCQRLVWTDLEQELYWSCAGNRVRTIGVEDRGSYYETAALCDMIQNHLLQLACLIAMEPPVSFNADEVRNRKVDVLRAVKKNITQRCAQLRSKANTMQAGSMEKVVAYRIEKVLIPIQKRKPLQLLNSSSTTGWQNVPFYLPHRKKEWMKRSLLLPSSSNLFSPAFPQSR